MSTITGTIDAVSILHSSVNGAGARKSYLLSCSFGAYTGSSDSGALSGVGAAIASARRDGKTNTLRTVVCVGPGLDTAAQAVYTGACTVSTDDLTFNLTNAAGTELTSATASSGVMLIATVDEA